MRCTKCAGLLVEGYDEVERVVFVRCLNCGARPAQAVRTLPVTAYRARLASGLCISCQIRPPRARKTATGTLHYRQPKRCAECAKAWRPGKKGVAA